MKVYVVNLDRSKDRLASVDSQLRRLGVAYERVSAVDARAMTEKERARAVNRFRWWCAVGRRVEPAEVGCALSHKGIYERMSGGEHVCILEDDVIIKDTFPMQLEEVEKAIDSAKPQVYLLSNRKNRFHGAGIVRSAYGFCTDGYVITKAAADAILAVNTPLKVPCDHWGRWVKQGVIELYHVLPESISQDRETFGSSTQADMKYVKDFPIGRWILHKAKRLVGFHIDKILLSCGK